MMGRLIGWLLGIPFAAVAVAFAISNRAPVQADLWPLPWAIEVPLYLLVLVALAIGFLAGGLIAWAGSLAARRRIRAEARAKGAEQARAEGAKYRRAEITATRRDTEFPNARADAADTRTALPPPVV